MDSSHQKKYIYSNEALACENWSTSKKMCKSCCQDDRVGGCWGATHASALVIVMLALVNTTNQSICYVIGV